MNELLEKMETINEIIEKTETLDMVLFFSLIGTMIDRWAYVNDLDPEQAEEMLNVLMLPAKDIHKDIGLW